MSDKFFAFDARHLEPLTQRLAGQYRNADPFPHVVIDDFLPLEVAESLLAHFPGTDSPVFANRSMPVQPGKFGTVDGQRLNHAHPYIQHMLLNFNSYTILYFLKELTGIEHLLSDPYFHGGGLHQIVKSGHLDIHADFNYQENLQLYRRINILYYLNKDWKSEYGGQLELWDKELTSCQHRIEPVFNRCVIFNTTKDSLHGHPQPLTVPPGVTRKSIALYYYTRDPAPEDPDIHKTLWKKV